MVKVTYDDRGNLITKKVKHDIYNEKVTVETNEYDLNNNLISKSDAYHKIYDYEYNSLGQLIKKTTAVDRKNVYMPDENGIYGNQVIEINYIE